MLRALSRRVGIAAFAGLTSVGGCALIVGDPAGNVQAGGDAGTHVDAGHADRPSVDRVAEGRATPDARPTDGSAEALVDVLGGAPGFCATYLPPVGAFSVCDDFDERGSDATALGGVAAYGLTATVATKPGHSKSPPHSLYVATAPAAAVGSTAGAYVSRVLAPGSIFTVDCDFLLENVPDVANSEFVSLLFSLGGETSGVVVDLLGDTQGNLRQVQVYEPDPDDAGTRYHTPVPLAFSGWGHFTLVVQKDPGGAVVDSLTINGIPRETNVALAPGFITAGPLVHIGWSFVNGVGTRSAYIDNVVVVSQ